MNVSMTAYSAQSSSPPPPPPPPSGHNETATEDILSFLDGNGDGELSSEEISGDSRLSSVMSDDVFAAADIDGSGTLSADELETTRPDGPPPPHAPQQTSSSGTDATSLFESLLQTSESDAAGFASTIENAMNSAQNMYEAMQDLFATVHA